MVFSQEINPVYLGFFGSEFATQSINNQFGTHGSQFSSLSVRNSFSPYGSNFGTYSANNNFTSTPPVIYKHGVAIGFLTANSLISGGVALPVIDVTCTFFAFAPFLIPFTPAGLTASDGLYSDKIKLDWASSEGALEYRVYIADSLTSQRVILGTVVDSNAEVIGLEPQVSYYFWVSAVNKVGESSLSVPDTGFIGVVGTNSEKIRGAMTAIISNLVLDNNKQ